ncbi:MAG: RagB/SusD family nutrient uptake outer membrane protein [Chitinophagaceae bacterium]|nr:MAG: RagB/SusD family nutrient uptake outer membrane protein [Chitinophagaceae bacterium]
MKSIIILIAIAAIGILSGCEKFLEEKPDVKLVVPQTVADLQSILNHPLIYQDDPAGGERSSDNYYVTSANWQSMRSEEDKRAYQWAGERIYVTGIDNEWARTYNHIYSANVVLHAFDGVTIQPGEQLAANIAAGTARFIRGRSIFNALVVWAPAFDEQNAGQDLGVSLRTDPDVNIPTTRASVRDCYDQVIADVREAVRLLPDVSSHPVQPSKAAASALLARVFLSMRMYDSALVYADISIQLKSDLFDLNNVVNPNATFTVSRFNPEVIYHAEMLAPNLLNTPRAKTDSTLYRSYETDDLRRTIYFKDNGDGTVGFRASYSGNNGGFSGLATNEVILMRAECLARKGDTEPAMQELNRLLQARWRTGSFVPKSAASASDALLIILNERRKELLLRGLRWMDIKRLNKEGYNIIQKRMINGVEYILEPNERRYALPIPEDVIAATGIQQN